MSSTDVTVKTTIMDRIASMIPTKTDTPVVRADATHHKFVKRTGGIWVETNPSREHSCIEQLNNLGKARDEKVNSAGAVRDAGLKEAKAVYDAAVAAIEKTHREAASVATQEFEAQQQNLLHAFAMPPADAKVEG